MRSRIECTREQRCSKVFLSSNAFPHTPKKGQAQKRRREAKKEKDFRNLLQVAHLSLYTAQVPPLPTGLATSRDCRRQLSIKLSPPNSRLVKTLVVETLRPTIVAHKPSPVRATHDFARANASEPILTMEDVIFLVASANDQGQTCSTMVGFEYSIGSHFRSTLCYCNTLS